MPGYGGMVDQYTPTPTEEVKTVEKRFVMPTLTLVQLILVGTIVVYAWKARKVKGAVVGSIAFAIGLLHIYDHMYRVKRGPEHLFFLPRVEGYDMWKRKKPKRSDSNASKAIEDAASKVASEMKNAMSFIR